MIERYLFCAPTATNTCRNMRDDLAAEKNLPFVGIFYSTFYGAVLTSMILSLCGGKGRSPGTSLIGITRRSVSYAILFLLESHAG